MENREYEKLIRQVPLFSGLNSFDVERISRLVIRRKIRKGQVIITEDQLLEGFYIVISGQIKVYKLSASGKEQIIHIVSSGDTFAEAAAFTSRHAPANAAAMIESEIFFMFTEDLIRLIKDTPQLSLNILASMSKYLRHLVNIIDELSLKEIPARLAKYLIDLSVKTNSKEIKLPISKKELSSSLGTVSEVISRTLGKLKSKKVIKVKGDIISILNKSRLEQIAAGMKF
jgi:CRP/FNR family transcriptional regulator